MNNDKLKLRELHNEKSDAPVSPISTNQEIQNSQHTIEQLIELSYGTKKYFQKRTILLFSLQMFVVSILLTSPPFLFIQPEFHCKNNSTYQVCYEDSGACKDNMTNVKIDIGDFESISDDYGLYCDINRRQIRNLGESLVYIGNALGLFLFTYLADNKGRRYAHGLSWFIGSIFTVVIVVFNDINVLLFSYFIIGACTTMNATINVVYLNEISFGNFRTMSVIFLWVVWGFAELAILPLSLIVSTWKQMFILSVTIPSVLLNAVYFYIPESPKYMYTKDKTKTVQIINQICRINKSPHVIQDNQLIDHQQQSNEKEYNFIDLFRYKSLRGNTIGLIVCMIFINLQYFGSNFILSRIGLNFQWNLFYIGIAETISQIIAVYICPNINRKKWSCLLSIAMSMSLFFSFFVKIPEECQDSHVMCWQKDFQISIIVLFRFINTFAFSLSVVWINELYPTTVRSLGSGIVTSFGLFGSFLSPQYQLFIFISFVVDLFYFVNVNPMIFLCACGIIGGLICLTLEETFNMPQKDQIDEMMDKNISLQDESKGEGQKQEIEKQKQEIEMN